MNRRVINVRDGPTSAVATEVTLPPSRVESASSPACAEHFGPLLLIELLNGPDQRFRIHANVTHTRLAQVHDQQHASRPHQQQQ